MDAAYDSEPLAFGSKKSKKVVQKSPKLVMYDDDSIGDLIIADDISLSSCSSKSKGTNSKLASTNNNKKRKRRDSAASSDEERWLTALEAGSIEDVNQDLTKIKLKDPSLMTARQRAMYDRNGDGCTSATSTLMSLPTGYKEKIMTAESIQKAALKSQKRKQLADEKREKDKKKTMDRLLKKQDSKINKASKPKPTKTIVPLVVYQQNIYQTTLTFPEGIDFPLKPQKISNPPPVKLCSMGCGNRKKYSCSQTGADLCSLTCYRRNISRRIL